MSEKRKIQRFNLDEGRIWEVVEGLSPCKTTYTLEEVCEKLNEQQELIEELQEENKQLKLTLSEYGVDLKAFEIFKQKIGYYDKVIDV